MHLAPCVFHGARARARTVGEGENGHGDVEEEGDLAPVRLRAEVAVADRARGDDLAKGRGVVQTPLRISCMENH